MNPHISTPSRPSTTQWKVGKRVSFLPLIFAVVALIVIVLLLVVTVQKIATRRAINACDAGHTACRVSMGFTRAHVLAEDANEDQTVCGDGWRECIDVAGEGNIQ